MRWPIRLAKKYLDIIMNWQKDAGDKPGGKVIALNSDCGHVLTVINPAIKVL